MRSFYNPSLGHIASILQSGNIFIFTVQDRNENKIEDWRMDNRELNKAIERLKNEGFIEL